MEKKKLDVIDIGDAKFQIKLAVLSCIMGLAFLAFGILGVQGSLAFLGFDYWFYVFSIVGGSVMNAVTVQPTIKNIKTIKQAQSEARAEKNAKTVILDKPYIDVSEKQIVQPLQETKHKTKENSKKESASNEEQPTK